MKLTLKRQRTPTTFRYRLTRWTKRNLELLKAATKILHLRQLPIFSSKRLIQKLMLPRARPTFQKGCTSTLQSTIKTPFNQLMSSRNRLSAPHVTATRTHFSTWPKKWWKDSESMTGLPKTPKMAMNRLSRLILKLHASTIDSTRTGWP